MAVLDRAHLLTPGAVASEIGACTLRHDVAFQGCDADISEVLPAAWHDLMCTGWARQHSMWADVQCMVPPTVPLHVAVTPSQHWRL